jgi:DNA-binding NtrC family response regulator
MLAEIHQSSTGSAAGPTRPSGENSPRPGKNFPRATVLVVDDEPLVRWSIAETLGDSGYKVSEAADAACALAAFETAPPADVVLLDLRLPDCDDLATLSAIRRLSPATRIVLLTAFGTPEIFAEARRLGAFAIMDKPFEIDAVRAVVDRALAGRTH